RAARGPRADDPRRPPRGRVPGQERLPVRPAAGAHPRGAPPRGRRAVRGAGPAAPARGAASTRRPARGCRDRRLLPFRLPLGRRRDGTPLGGLPGAQLPRLVARVVTPRRAADRAVTSRVGLQPDPTGSAARGRRLTPVPT